MARFLLATVPLTGHFAPGLPIARMLVERGHDVWWYTGRKFQQNVEATGATFVSFTEAREFNDDLNIDMPERKKLSGLNLLKYDLKHFFADSVPGHVKDLQNFLAENPVDVIIGDTGFSAMGVLHEIGGPVWASFGITALPFSSKDTAPFGLGMQPDASFKGRIRNRVLNALIDTVVFRDVKLHNNSVRALLGLPPVSSGVIDGALSPYLYMQASIPEFEYPRSDIAPQVHFIGPFLPAKSADFVPPAWWNEMVNSKRPVVHVTQGTLATDGNDLLVPTIKALANSDVLVIVSTGGKPVESLGLNQLPENVRVESFIPYAHLMPHVNLMVTNGGYGGVQIALAHGVPVIVAGTTEDKMEIGARVEWAGVGMNLKTDRPSEEQIRDAVWWSLRDKVFTHIRARQMQAAYAKMDAACKAAVLLEQLAATRKPVLARKNAPAQVKRTTSTIPALGEI